MTDIELICVGARMLFEPEILLDQLEHQIYREYSKKGYIRKHVEKMVMT